MKLTSLHSAESTELSPQRPGDSRKAAKDNLAKAAPEMAEVWVILGAMAELMGPPFSQHNHQMPTQYGWPLLIPDLSPGPEKWDVDYPRIPASAPNGLRPRGLVSLQEVSPEPSQAWDRETWERRHGVN